MEASAAHPNEERGGSTATGQPAGAAAARPRGGEEPSRFRPVAKARHRAQEDAELADELTSWVQRNCPQDEIRRHYMALQVATRLRTYRTWAKFWRYVQISSWLVVATLGLLITVFAGLKTGHAFTIVGGALVAMLTTLTNAAHPSKLADGYENAREALHAEAWDLLTGTGDYAKPDLADATARFNHFKDRVTAIVVSKRASTKLDALAPS